MLSCVRCGVWTTTCGSTPTRSSSTLCQRTLSSACETRALSTRTSQQVSLKPFAPDPRCICWCLGVVVHQRRTSRADAAQRANADASSGFCGISYRGRVDVHRSRGGDDHSGMCAVFCFLILQHHFPTSQPQHRALSIPHAALPRGRRSTVPLVLNRPRVPGRQIGPPRHDSASAESGAVGSDLLLQQLRSHCRPVLALGRVQVTTHPPMWCTISIDPRQAIRSSGVRSWVWG